MKEEELRSFRNEINRIDAEMKELFVKRMETAKKIGLYKKERGLPVFDAEREKEVIRANASS
jgi:chorismate mutase